VRTQYVCQIDEGGAGEWAGDDGRGVKPWRVEHAVELDVGLWLSRDCARTPRSAVVSGLVCRDRSVSSEPRASCGRIRSPVQRRLMSGRPLHVWEGVRTCGHSLHSLRVIEEDVDGTKARGTDVCRLEASRKRRGVHTVLHCKPWRVRCYINSSASFQIASCVHALADYEGARLDTPLATTCWRSKGGTGLRTGVSLSFLVTL
jgi:hypothetical protein